MAATSKIQTTKKDQIREAAEADLETFIRLVAPKRVLGSIHTEVCRWWTKETAKSHQLILLPRDHGKSAMVAYRVAWWITKFPDTRILYISATSNLAEKQLKFIKDILTCSLYRKYWPDMVEVEEAKREKWTNSEISVDHPKRKEEAVRDPTIFTGGLTTNLVGLHCDVAVFDDVVVFDNAYTEEGRDRTRQQYSLLSSIEGADAKEWVVGTRYHVKDLYSDMLRMETENFDDQGEQLEPTPVFEILERQVEDGDDGYGEFIWPRQQASNGKWYGFDSKVLARKKAQYLDRTQFRAQYYNDPNDPGELRIGRNKFQYYDKKFVNMNNGFWFFKDQRLNVVASCDFAYSMGKRSDYTCVVVVGIDSKQNIYVLDIDRFKTEKISEYYSHILDLHKRWDFRKIACETTAAQKAIVEQLKDGYIRPNGIYLSIIDVPRTRHDGNKQERISAILEPKYDNMQVWHYQGGNCQVLEDELISDHPPHDDVSDALSTAIEYAQPPSGILGRNKPVSNWSRGNNNVIWNTRFGGVAA